MMKFTKEIFSKTMIKVMKSFKSPSVNSWQSKDSTEEVFKNSLIPNNIPLLLYLRIIHGQKFIPGRL